MMKSKSAPRSQRHRYFVKSLLPLLGLLKREGSPSSSFPSHCRLARERPKNRRKIEFAAHNLGVPSSATASLSLSGLLLSLPVIPHLISDILPHMTPRSSGETEDRRKRAVVDDQKVTRHSCCDRAKRSRPMIHGKTQGERPVCNLVWTLQSVALALSLGLH